MSTITKDYNDDAIQTLEWNEHIRQRPGMYIGNTGDGSRPDDGIYILIKEVLDNSIDEFSSGYGKEIKMKNVTLCSRVAAVLMILMLKRNMIVSLPNICPI